MRLSMMPGVLAAAVMAATAVGAARAQDRENELSAARDEAEAAKPPKRGPFVKQSKACGAAANYFFCGQVKKDTVGNLYLAPYSVKFAEKGKATVTWTGSVFCYVNSPDPVTAQSARRTYMSYYTHLGLVTSPNEDITPNATGTTSIGEELDFYFLAPAINQDIFFRRSALTPVTLTKTYTVKKAKTVSFQVAVKPDFRAFKYDPYCNINGGTTTVRFQPG